MVRVLIHFDRPELFTDLLESRFPGVEHRCCSSYDDLETVIEDFSPDALFVIKFEDRSYPREAVLNSSSLKWVHVGGSGVDHLSPWDPERLTVTNGAGITAEVMANYALGAIIALASRFPQFARQQQRHEWKARYISSPEGKTVTIVGLGHVGRAIAKRAKVLGMTVVGTRRNPKKTDKVDYIFGHDRLHEALALGDFVIISAPLLEETRKLIGWEAFKSMKDGACFIDISRGGVTDGKALISALQQGKLGGAVLDVFEDEPPAEDSPLWDMENVLITPHNAAIFDGWERLAFARFCDNLEFFLEERPLPNSVDPQKGY